MTKETYYFSHDYHARKDPKCIALFKDFGPTGYGVYWSLIEIMYEQGGKIKKFPSLISGLSHEFHISEKILSKQIEAMLHKYELLLQDGSYIWSNAVLDRLQIREAKKVLRSEAGKKGGISSGLSRRSEAKRSNAWHGLKQNEANEAKERKGKESKVNNKRESKERKEITPANNENLKDSNLFRKPNIPGKEEVLRVFLQQGGTKEMAKKFYERNDSTGWFSRGSPITNFANLVPSFVENWNKNLNGKYQSESSAPPLKNANELN